MRIVNTVFELREAVKTWRLDDESVAFVPTMGNLHAGHLQLEHLLPRRQLTAEELADIISKRHYLRRKAKESQARRSQVARE